MGGVKKVCCPHSFSMLRLDTPFRESAHTRRESAHTRVWEREQRNQRTRDGEGGEEGEEEKRWRTYEQDTAEKDGHPALALVYRVWAEH